MQSELTMQSSKVKPEDIGRFISLLGTAPDRKIGDLFGVSGGYVSFFRRKLAVPPHSPPRRPPEVCRKLESDPEFLSDLVVLPDTAVAAKYAVPYGSVTGLRKRLKIYKDKHANCPSRYLAGRDETWLQELYAKLGTASDAKVAEQFGLAESTIFALRKERDVLPYRRKSLTELVENEELIAQLGRVPDHILAKKYSTSKWAIKKLRKEREIPVFDRRYVKLRENVLQAHDREIAAGAEWWQQASDSDKDAVFARISRMWADCQRKDRYIGAIVARMAMIGFVTCDLSVEDPTPQG